MCGRSGHLYGRCRISTERRVSRPTPDQNPGKKNSHREMLGDAPWGDVREMRSSLREMQDLHRETRLPTDPRPVSGEKNSHRGMLGDAPSGDVRISTGGGGERRSSLREMQDLHRETRLPTDPRPESGEKILIGRCWEMHHGQM